MFNLKALHLDAGRIQRRERHLLEAREVATRLAQKQEKGNTKDGVGVRGGNDK